MCNTLHRYADELHAELLIVRRLSTTLCDCVGSGSSLVKCISTGSVSRYDSLILIVDFGITLPLSITLPSCSRKKSCSTDLVEEIGEFVRILIAGILISTR